MKKVLVFLLISLLVILPLFSSARAGARFTIQAAPDLRPGLAALYGARYAGETPEFVESGGDLLATADISAHKLDTLPAYYLPGVALLPQTTNVEAAEFVAFAVSPDGQQVLIEQGLLPAVVTVTDQAGKTIEIRQPVRRLVTPYSLATYYVYGVGAGDRLVAAGFLGARDPQGAAVMTRIDARFPELSKYRMSQSELNVEEVATLQPDVILTSARSRWLDAVAALNIPVVLYEGETPERLKEAVLLTGQILGPNAAAQAQAWAVYYDAIFERVVRATQGQSERRRVLFTGTEPLRVASGQMYQSEIIAAAGGLSVSAELKGFWNDVNLEQVLNWNPDVIFVPPYGGASVEKITDSPEWQVIAAVKNGSVYRVPKLVAPWDTPVPESALGVLWMAHTLYPDRISFDCEAEVTAFYKQFYRYDLLPEDIASTCGS